MIPCPAYCIFAMNSITGILLFFLFLYVIPLLILVVVSIRSVDEAGNVATVAGVAGVMGKNDGKTVTATFNRPRGITMNSAGTHLFVTDLHGCRIRCIGNSGNNTFFFAFPDKVFMGVTFFLHRQCRQVHCRITAYVTSA